MEVLIFLLVFVVVFAAIFIPGYAKLQRDHTKAIAKIYADAVMVREGDGLGQKASEATNE